MVVYFGLHININNLGGNDFFNFLVFAAIEFPAYFLGRWPAAGCVAQTVIAIKPTVDFAA